MAESSSSVVVSLDAKAAQKVPKIISLLGSRIVFSVKVLPAYGDLPAPSTTEALGIEAPALPIGSPDMSKYAVPILCTAGNKRSEPYHK
jgi:hypothetical protein